MLNLFLVNYEYSSLLINLPVRLTEDIVNWGISNIPDNILYREFDEKHNGRQFNAHVTLLYGLYSNNHESYKNLFFQTKPFICELQEISVFENQKFDVLMIKIGSEELYKLHKKLSKTLDFEPLYPDYIPHVTIAYLKSGQGKMYNGLTTFKSRKFTVNNIVFSSKLQNKYKIELGAL
jgi:2'-5' RNA ligase